MTTSFADVRAAFRARERSVTLIGDGAALAELDALNAELAQAEKDPSADTFAGNPVVPALRERIAEVEATLQASTVTFRVRGIGRNAYRRLIAAHPSEESAWNLDTFPQALVAACSLDPVMTVGDVDQLLDVLTEGQFDRLFAAAHGVCNEVDGVPFKRTG